jgi:hypothetical protein
MKTRLDLRKDSDATASLRRLAGGQNLLALINAPWPKALLISIAIAMICLFYFSAFRPDRFGFYRDDSMYVVLAKALATDQDYRIISLPYEPAQTKSPPFYPLLLSLIWRAWPDFPQNLVAMMLLSVAATVGFLALSYLYLVRRGYAGRWQALVAVGLAAVNWRTVVLATGIYSEMFYALLSVGALYLAEKHEKERSRWAIGSALGVITGLAFLSRSAGVSLLFAIAFYYLLRRHWRGLLPVAIGAAFVIAWLAWGFFHSSGAGNTNAGSYESYLQTLNAVVSDLQAQNNHSGFITLLSIIAKNALGLILISIPVVCLGLSFDSVLYFGFAFLFIAAGFLRQSRQALGLMHVYIISYLVIHLPWPYTSYDRFLLPLLPFLLLFLLIELHAMYALIRKEVEAKGELIRSASAAFIGLALAVSVGVALYNYALGIHRSLALATLTKVAQPAPDDADAIEWIKSHTGPSDVLICYRDPLYYLYTARKAARSSSVREGGSLQSSQAAIEIEAHRILRIVEENDGRYIVLTPSDFGLEYQPDSQREALRSFIEQHPEKFVPVFTSTNEGSLIFRIEHSPR